MGFGGGAAHGVEVEGSIVVFVFGVFFFFGFLGREMEVVRSAMDCWVEGTESTRVFCDEM